MLISCLPCISEGCMSSLPLLKIDLKPTDQHIKQDDYSNILPGHPLAKRPGHGQAMCRGTRSTDADSTLTIDRHLSTSPTPDMC